MTVALKVIQGRESLKRTWSRCPYCQQRIEAEVVKTGSNPGQIMLERNCPTHGQISSCISSNARFYWLSVGASSCCSGSACCAEDGKSVGMLGSNAARPQETFEALSTCLALIEIVNSCNLSCPTCFANSPLGAGHKVDAVPLEQICTRIENVIKRKGKIELLQLSGGEPTLHPHFFELLDWIKSNSKIDYLLINTNGILLAKDPSFLDRLAKRAHRDNIQLYLQFDGVQPEGQAQLRGSDLRSVKEQAIMNAASINLPVTLAMTVIRDNLEHLWESIQFGLKFDNIRGIAFQPFFGSGRFTEGSGSPARLNSADIITSCITQSNGKLTIEDFTPLPCGDPNCAIIGYLLKMGSEVRSISDFISFQNVQGFLKDRIRYRLEDLMQCGCESEPLGAILKKLELNESHTFRIFIKPFMDAWSWDEDRIDRCCTHVIRPDGKLDSFCRYYSKFSDLEPSAA